jgi:hypothetical protein
MMKPTESPPHWRFNKDISIADVISIVSAALALLYTYTTLDKRLELLERAVQTQAINDRRQDDDAVRAQARIDAQLQQINAKLDRLVERQK